MNSKVEDFDKYEDYESQFNPIYNDRQARRKRRSKQSHTPKVSPQEAIAESAETIGLEGGFVTTYQPSRHESIWLLESLRDFYQQELISDVMALVKGGKEANVYRCAAHLATGQEWLAVKVYRPRVFRNLRNDQVYRQGRTVLTPNGRPVPGRDTRLQRAVRKKTPFGQQVSHTSWLMHEYTTLELLYEAGGSVPKPYAATENAILMDYLGDEAGAAPALNEITLARGEAWPLFRKVVENIRLLLDYGRVHGDLSAYNILYWEGDVSLIDFPQVVNCRVSRETHPLFSEVNPDAYEILARDVTRVCDYFRGQGVSCDAQALVDELWEQFAVENNQFKLATASRWEEEP